MKVLISLSCCAAISRKALSLLKVRSTTFFAIAGEVGMAFQETIAPWVR